MHSNGRDTSMKLHNKSMELCSRETVYNTTCSKGKAADRRTPAESGWAMAEDTSAFETMQKQIQEYTTVRWAEQLNNDNICEEESIVREESAIKVKACLKKYLK